MPFQKSACAYVAMMLRLVVAMLTLSHVEASETWSPAPLMGAPRAFHTATLLPDGRVLVTGGYSGDYPDHTAPVSSAELYDSRLGTWSPTAPMSTARYWHTATLLPDGRVLVSGGISQYNYLASAEIYDPKRGTWSPAGSMTTSRFSHAATLLPDGRVLVSGGSADWLSYLASAEIYDPERGTWSATGSMSTARLAHTATRLPDGRVLAGGGYYDALSSSASAELYDPPSGTWSATGSMSTARTEHTATLLPDGRVLVSGGYDAYDYQMVYLASAEFYDPALGTWSPTGSMSTPRNQHASTLLADGRVLVSGGSFGTGYLASAEIYDATGGTWLAAGSMSTARTAFTATLLPDRRVLVSGGFVHAYLASAEFYGLEATSTADATPPQVSCLVADGAWHNRDVTITCTASDLESGLANPADESFDLTTNVPVGTETASAVTNSRQVCDMAGNCSTAGPITGNKVDKKGPTIAIASPASGATYALNTKVGASYACSDNASGLTSCAGPVANGSRVNTSPLGTKTFVVTATDGVGNSSTRSVTYTVVTPKK